MSHITTGIIQGNQLVVVPIATTLRGAAGSAGATGPAGAAGPEGLAVVGVTGPVGGLDGAVTEHLVPETVGTYDLGASGNHFRDLWLDGESFYLWDKEEERYLKLAQEGGKIKPGWADESLAPMACSGDGGDELDSVGGTWAASTTYAAGDQVCHRDPGGSELSCYECEPPSVMASTISGVCCLDLDDTSGERCINTTMANCCAEGGTLFYPNVTCAEIDNSETYWNICESGAGGGDPCQGFGDSDSSVDECLGTQPGETPDWKTCGGEEEFVSTRQIKMRVPCDNPRLMRLGPQLKGENKGQFPYVQFWRGPYNVNNTGQYTSPSREWGATELAFAENLSTVERVWVGDIAVDEKSWYSTRNGEGLKSRPHHEGAGDDRKYVWPELNYDDFGNSKDPVLLMFVMRMDENNTTVYDDHVAIWLRSPIVECSETDGGFNSAVGIGKFFDFCRDGKASNVEGQKEYEINYSFMPSGCKIQQMTAAARALSPWLNDKIPVGAGWTEANTSTLDWGQTSIVGPNFNGIDGKNLGDWSSTSTLAISANDMMTEVANSMEMWEDAFNNVIGAQGHGGTVKFTNLGLEDASNYVGDYANAQYAKANPDTTAQPYPCTKQFKIKGDAGWPGNIRFGITEYRMDKRQVLASATQLRNAFDVGADEDWVGVKGSTQGSVLLNKYTHWSTESVNWNQNFATNGGPSQNAPSPPAWDAGIKVKFSFSAAPHILPYSKKADGSQYQGKGLRMNEMKALKLELPAYGDTQSISANLCHEIGHVLGFSHTIPLGMTSPLPQSWKKPWAYPRGIGQQDAWFIAGFGEAEAKKKYGALMKHRTHWKKETYLEFSDRNRHRYVYAQQMLTPWTENEFVHDIWNNPIWSYAGNRFKYDPKIMELIETKCKLNLAKYNKRKGRFYTVLHIEDRTNGRPLKEGEMVWVCIKKDGAYKNQGFQDITLGDKKKTASSKSATEQMLTRNANLPPTPWATGETYKGPNLT